MVLHNDASIALSTRQFEVNRSKDHLVRIRDNGDKLMTRTESTVLPTAPKRLFDLFTWNQYRPDQEVILLRFGYLVLVVVVYCAGLQCLEFCSSPSKTKTEKCRHLIGVHSTVLFRLWCQAAGFPTLLHAFARFYTLRLPWTFERGEARFCVQWLVWLPTMTSWRRQQCREGGNGSVVKLS